MQSIKRFSKQLGFVVLTGSAMFSVSSVSAQVPPRITTPILVNTDIIVDPLRFGPPDFPLNTNQLFLSQIGGVVSIDPDGPRVTVNNSRFLFDPFNTSPAGYNNQSVGASTLNGFLRAGSVSRLEAVGVFSENRNTNPPIELQFGLTSNSINPPALKSNGTTCKNEISGCVRFHYGYTQDVLAGRTLTPKFLYSFLVARDAARTGSTFIEAKMASPTLTGTALSLDSINEYVVVYSEQTDPLNPDAVTSNWTEFPVVSGAEQTLRFSNDESNSSSVIISNTRVLRSATQIPLAQLTTADLPPTDPRFVPVPSADGIVAPGEVKPPVPVPGPITAVLNRITKFNGTSDFVEIPNNDNLNFGTGNLSISAWVKTSSNNGLEIILDKRVEASGPVQGYSIVNYFGTLLLQLADGEGNQFTNYISNISIADGKLHHIAVTVDRAQLDGGRWYIDGVEVVGQRFNPTRRGSLSNSKPLVIGRRSDSGSPGFFNGEIGPVGVTNRVLSPQDIQSIAAIRP